MGAALKLSAVKFQDIVSSHSQLEATELWKEWKCSGSVLLGEQKTDHLPWHNVLAHIIESVPSWILNDLFTFKETREYFYGYNFLPFT